jgi:hypothetical protein
MEVGTMAFVMVPVPEEHVFEVMQYLVRLAARAALKPWDEESVHEFFADADEPSRSMLSLIARATLAGKDINAGAIAQSLELQLRDLSPIIRAMDARWKGLGRIALFETRDVTEMRPSGNPWTVRNFVMADDVAKMVRSAEQRVREVEPHPLAGATG